MGRRSPRSARSDSLRNGGEARWKWGLFYHSADDAALVVPKRMGIGYTLNFGSAPDCSVAGRPFDD